VSLSYLLNVFNSEEFDVINANHHNFNIERMGLKLVLFECLDKFQLPDEIPQYLMETVDFNYNGLFIFCVSPKNFDRIRRNFTRILNVIFTRSLAYYFLQDTFSFDIEKHNGLFPVIERQHSFLNTPNYFKIHKKKYFYSGSNFLDNMKNWNIFQGILPHHLYLNLSNIDTVLEQLEKDKSVNNRIDSDFFSAIPFHTPIITHAKNTIIYIKALNNSNTRNPNQLPSLLIPIRNFIQVWAIRSVIMETNTSLFCNIVIPDYEKTFVKKIKKYIKNNDLNCILLFKVIDFYNKSTLKNRYRNQFLLPDFSLFNQDTLEYNIPFPTIREIKKTFSIKEKKH
jgi:hypothetical protein